MITDDRDQMQGYLNSHGVQEFIETTVNQLCRELPSEPFPFISNLAYEKCKPPLPEVIFVLGGPGAGKGTQCDNIRRHLGFVHLSAGDLLRAEVKKGGPKAEKIQGHIKEGSLVPAALTVDLLKSAMDASMMVGQTRFLVDGFPRDQGNVDAWDKVVGKNAKVLCCLYLNLSAELMEERLLERGKSSGRSDDNLETIKKRIKVFYETSLPIIDIYRNLNILREVDSTNLNTVDNVWAEVHRVLVAVTRGSQQEVICVLLKPDAVSNAMVMKKLNQALVQQAFTVLERRRVKLRRKLATVIFQAFKEQKHFEELISFVCGGACEVMVLRRDHAVSFWARLMGDNEEPEQNRMARCLRKQFGKSAVENLATVCPTLEEYHRIMDLLCPANVYTVQTSRPKALLIAGPPAAGKGTQCDLLVKHYGLAHISTGDLLRDAVKEGTELGKQAASFMDKGDLVPDELMVNLVNERLKQPDVKEKGYLLDGFPRTASQAQTMLKQGVLPQAVIIINVPDEILVERVEGRRLDPETGKIYHLKFQPPPDEVKDRCTQRQDDTADKIKVRLGNYYTHLQPIEAVFGEKVCYVNGNQALAKVFAEIRQHLE
eukprot:gb/GEZN01002381.1/.p1 GENE.gb/GEZN01002381.1/~~gb/GEZN01002381.1/.p1  ORF type:complete len:613 (+),score=118.27 gb/GEZN01002381.1/:41-1840(+)